MVLWACGWSYLLLAGFYLVIDVLGYRRWALFFVVLGSNAILVYVGVGVVNFHQIANFFVGGVARNLIAQGGWLEAFGHALSPITAFALVWLVLWYLYRKGTFVRV